VRTNRLCIYSQPKKKENTRITHNSPLDNEPQCPPFAQNGTHKPLLYNPYPIIPTMVNKGANLGENLEKFRKI